ncbi:DUF3888 domain-containing protein [Neobacillus sp. Marseille-QA0830]
MKYPVILLGAMLGCFFSFHTAQASLSLKTEDVSSIQVSRLSGGSRVFRENDGYEEPVVRKVVEWLNTANPINAATDLHQPKAPTAVLKINMKNGDVLTVEPAYHCTDQNKSKTCTLADGEVLVIHNNQSDQLKSTELFDWLLAGWKYENVEPPKDSDELIIRDILMVMLDDEIEKAVDQYYSAYLISPPTVYLYMVENVHVKRIGGFRRFHFLITLETTPVVGAHNPVGKDRLTFEIAPPIPGKIKLKKYEHLETHELPPHLQNILKPR